MDDRGGSKYLLSQESSYSMTAKRSHSEITFNPTVISSLVGQADGDVRYGSPSYGSGGDTEGILLTQSEATAESSTPEADKAPLLSDKIRKKKQG